MLNLIDYLIFLFYRFMITTFQFRAARSGIGITLKELSKITRVSYVTLCKLEDGPPFHYYKLRKGTLEKITEFYNQCGVSFLDDNGVAIEFTPRRK